MATICLENVTKRFKPNEGFCAVFNLNFKVKDGEFFCLVGPSNSGKTTTLRLIAGLAKPDSGQIYIDGTPVNDVPPSRRNVAMLFESLALYPNKTGYENIASPLKVKKVPKEEISNRVMEAAKLLNLEHVLSRYPATYSGGEKQRVALARILVQHPNAYLLDEPLGGLDARLRITTRTKLKELQKELGQTMVLVTHDQEEAMGLGDRIGVLKEGIIQQIGSPQELYDRPLNYFVAKTIGKPMMNFFECNLRRQEDRIQVAHQWFRVDITERWLQCRADCDKEEIILGIRPEHIEVKDKRDSDEAFLATVFITEPLGSKTIVDFQVGRETIRVLVPGDIELEINQSKWLLFRKEKLHLFEKDSQRAIFQ
ncbi:MAG: ABC transporter ATP-binding protein [Deltaproteobacteria bacterium]|nr:ABC transporter ATP-binding protein [Deltaproteobacteria bacterium]